MPAIPIADGFGLNVQANPGPASAFAKYFQQSAGFSVLQRDLYSVQNTPLSGFPFKSTEIGLSFTNPTALASTSPQFAGSAAASASLCVVTGGKLFDPDPCGCPIDVPSGRAYLGVGVKVVLAPAVNVGTAKLEFGFAVGSTVSMSHYQAFSTNASSPTFKTALEAALQNYVIPFTLEDLDAMGVGDVAIIEGMGSLKLSGTFDLLTAVNPLVSVSSAALPATIQVQEGATISVSASCTITGDLQVRAQKVDAGTIRLGVYRKRGAEYTVQVEPSVGLTAGTRSTDFISAVLGAVGPNPFPSADQLQKSGLTSEKQEAIVTALKAGIQRSLALSIQADLHARDSEEAAFLYEFSLDRLGTAARNAIQDALRLNLSALSESASTLPAGIREVQSLLTNTREMGGTLKLNILGIYNLTSLSDLTLKGTVLTDPASGEVLIADTATATRVLGAVNYLADSDKLRKALAQSFLITAAYRCSGLIAHAPSLKVSYWHFAEHAKTDRFTMAANLHPLTCLGLMTATQEQQNLMLAEDFGHSTFYLSTGYDDALSQSLFLNSNGQPRGLGEYERIGRKALQLLIVPGAEDSFRVRALVDDAVWQKVRDTGGTAVNLAPIFPDLNPDTQIPVIAGDYVLIAWWATTMARMAQSLSSAKRFFSSDPPPAASSPAFKKVQNELWHQLADVASNTHDRFSDPWGVLAMDLASGQQSEARAQIVSPLLTLRTERSKKLTSAL